MSEQTKIDQFRAGAHAAEIWTAILGDNENGCSFAVVLGAIAMVDREAIANGIVRIGHETSIGPMVNPTAYLDGRRFRNGDLYRDILVAARGLKDALDKCMQEQSKP